MNKKQHKKSSPKALIAVMLTFMIAVISGRSNAAPNELEAVLEHKVNTEQLSIGVSVATIENGNINFINLGFADKLKTKPVNQNTLFEIGSATKLFTSTALATMVDEGKVQLAEPVQKYLPKNLTLPSKNDSVITFESLANHSSGLPRLPTNMPFGDPLNPYADYTTELLYEFLNNYTLPRAVGDKPEYSNLGTGLLGHTLATIDNMSFEQMLTKRVLTPLNMHNTYINVPQSQLSNRSQGHNGSLDATPFWQLDTLAGAGALVSNTADMANFLQAHMARNKLSSAIKLMQQPTADFGNPNTQVALGWIMPKTANGQLYMHNGQTGGFVSFIGFNPTLKKGIVILSNASILLDDIGYAYLTNSLSNIALTTPLSVTSNQLQKLVGEYQLAPGFVLNITHEDNGLFVQATNQPKLPLTANSITEFVNLSVQAMVKFEVDENGVATSLALHQGGQVLPGKKIK